MIQLLENRREAIAEACARYGVARLEAFGSALHEEFNVEKSDVDLLVDFGPMALYARVDAYFGLRDELGMLLNREIDLIMVGPSRIGISPVTSSARSSCSMPRDERAYWADILDSSVRQPSGSKSWSRDGVG